jgi:hypothetical protein
MKAECANSMAETVTRPKGISQGPPRTSPPTVKVVSVMEEPRAELGEEQTDCFSGEGADGNWYYAYPRMSRSEETKSRRPTSWRG